MEHDKDKERLEGWKEIADYLDRSVRTVQRWAKEHSLPIHHPPDIERGMVFAYKNELENWLKIKSEAFPLIYIPRIIRSAASWWMIHILAFILIILLFLSYLKPREKVLYPDSFRIVGSRFIILDKKGKKLWEYDTHLPLVEKEPPSNRREQLPLVRFVKLDYGRGIKTLLAARTREQPSRLFLICLSNKGRLLWQHQLGKPLICGKGRIIPEYDLIRLETVDLDRRGGLETVALIRHKASFPSVILIFASNGERVGEYLNCGELSHLLVTDLDKDGFSEIIAAGVNTAYSRPCIVLLDPKAVHGSSPLPDHPEYAIKGIPRGMEKYYLLLPNTDLAELFSPYYYINELLPAPSINGFTVLLFIPETMEHPGVYGLMFQFDCKLHPLHLEIEDRFIAVRNEFVRRGRLPPMVPDYEDRLIKGIRWWDGEHWRSQPTMNKFWKGWGR
jgi:hypothetical protein